MKIKPISDRIVVERLEQEQQTSGGIFIPDSAKEKSQQGRVVAVGPGKIADHGDRFPLQVSEGDTVLFSKYAGTDVKISGTDYIIMREDDILAAFIKE